MSSFQFFSARFTTILWRYERRREDLSLKSNDKLLSDLLERILFNEKDFDDFKSVIFNVSIGKNDPRLLKEKIISSRVRILEELKDLFPFYMNQIIKKQSIEKFVNEGNNSGLIEELRDKDDFLTKIGSRIDVIFKKIKEKE